MDVVENSLGVSAEEILTRLEHRPEALLALKHRVLDAVAHTWISPTLAENQGHEARGELWPVVPTSLADLFVLADLRSGGRNGRLGIPGKTTTRTRHEVQSLLLYAHGVHLRSPLEAGDGAIDNATFLHSLGQVVAIAPLVRSGVVRYYGGDDEGVPLDLSGEELESLRESMGLALASMEFVPGLNQQRLYDAASILVERAAHVLASHLGAGPGGTVLFSSRYERAALAAVVHTLQQGVILDTDPEGAVVALDHLRDLRLPTLSGLALRDVVHIRDDDSFGIFRTDVARALQDVAPDLDAARVDQARTTFAEHMDAGMARLTVRTKAGVIRDAALGGAVGWGIGAIAAASVAGWQALLTGIAGNLIAATADRTGRGRRALRNHYVQLGTERSAADQLRPTPSFINFDTDELWGRHRGRAYKAARVQEILDAAAARFEEE